MFNEWGLHQIVTDVQVSFFGQSYTQEAEIIKIVDVKITEKL